jgi:hypothetical protein
MTLIGSSVVDPDHFGNMDQHSDPHPHQKNADPHPDPHQSNSWIRNRILVHIADDKAKTYGI